MRTHDQPGLPELAARFAPEAACGRAPTRPAPDDPAWQALRPEGLQARFGRRALSLVLAATGLAPAALLALPIALALACEHGPRQVLFLQERVGWRGRTFRILKFRTLPAGESDAPADARASRFGRFLRRTHLDELPQLVNVLRGDMELIGPRPETLALDAWARAHLADFHLRNAVRPGLTGLAQVTMGYAAAELEAYREKLWLDRRSLARITLRGDLALLARTLLWVLRARGGRPLPRALLRARPRRAAAARRRE